MPTDSVKSTLGTRLNDAPAKMNNWSIDHYSETTHIWLLSFDSATNALISVPAEERDKIQNINSSLQSAKRHVMFSF